MYLLVGKVGLSGGRSLSAPTSIHPNHAEDNREANPRGITPGACLPRGAQQGIKPRSPSPRQILHVFFWAQARRGCGLPSPEGSDNATGEQHPPPIPPLFCHGPCSALLGLHGDDLDGSRGPESGVDVVGEDAIPRELSDAPVLLKCGLGGVQHHFRGLRHAGQVHAAEDGQQRVTVWLAIRLQVLLVQRLEGLQDTDRHGDLEIRAGLRRDARAFPCALRKGFEALGEVAGEQHGHADVQVALEIEAQQIGHDLQQQSDMRS
mmetsp:Transcript_62568/g.100809  ORF Transcript_62568/g.100809 Transcript_62568/m.100809 type:complete len:263 (-) Transcript_62568:5692-6480(-)